MKPIKTRKFSKNQMLVHMSLLIALSYLGSLIKIQGTIALDALPAYYGALLLGPVPGAIIGVVGHLLTALTSGFPLTLPLHLVVALTMAITVGAFGYVAQRINQFIAVGVGIILNGPGSTLAVAFIASLMGLDFAGKVMFYALVLPLTITSAVNVIGGVLLYGVMARYTQKQSGDVSRGETP